MDRQVEVVINFETGLHQLDQPAEDQGVGTASDELWSARMAIAELTSKSGGRSSGLEPKGVEEHMLGPEIKQDLLSSRRKSRPKRANSRVKGQGLYLQYSYTFMNQNWLRVACNGCSYWKAIICTC